MLEVHRENILTALKHLPMASSRQMETMFQDYSSPTKKVSKGMTTLEQEKLIEGKRQGNMEKVWRLTKEGRALMKVTRKPVPLQTLKQKHFLAIGDIYFTLRSEDLARFQVERRFEYVKGNEKVKYAPDILMLYKKKLYIVEVQIKPLSIKEWSGKWQSANSFILHGFKASPLEKLGIPHYIVVTDQKEENVKEGFIISNRSLQVIKDVRELLS